MQAAEHPNPEAHTQQADSTTWTYPTRFCRICREDVPATVTMYPPGLPMQFQTPIVEYRNDDEYGRLIKPCHCRGSLRYIHELCLLRSRTENRRAGSMWKCHECGHQFNFKRLAIQRYISSWYTVSVLTVLFMICVVFILGNTYTSVRYAIVVQSVINLASPIIAGLGSSLCSSWCVDDVCVSASSAVAEYRPKQMLRESITSSSSGESSAAQGSWSEAKALLRDEWSMRVGSVLMVKPSRDHSCCLVVGRDILGIT